MTRSRSGDLLVFGTALLLLIVDQLSKHWVRTNLVLGVPFDPISWLRPILSVTYVTNVGAAFGMFPFLRPIYPLIYVVVIVIVLVTYRTLATESRWVQLSLGMQLAGAMGNLVDRLRFGGQVTDFIDLNFWPLQEWPVFNVADSSVFVGVCILAVFVLFSAGSAAPDEGPTDQL